MRPYLIQRAKFETDTDRIGLDSILAFDYMGSAEFEFGALPKSLKRIRDKISDYTYFQYSFYNHPSKVVTVFCKKTQELIIPEILEDLFKDKYRLKEHCDLYNFVTPTTSYRTSDFWWDIENDYMFWRLDTDFHSQFKKKIINN